MRASLSYLPIFTPCLYCEELQNKNPSLNRQLHFCALTSFRLKCVKVIIIDFCWGVCFHPETMSSLRGPMHMASSFRTRFYTLYIIRWTSFRSRFTPESKERNISLEENAAFFYFCIAIIQIKHISPLNYHYFNAKKHVVALKKKKRLNFLYAFVSSDFVVKRDLDVCFCEIHPNETFLQNSQTEHFYFLFSHQQDRINTVTKHMLTGQ